MGLALSSVEVKANQIQSWRCYTGFSSRIRSLHAGGYPWETMGNRIQGPVGRGAKYEAAVGQPHRPVT